MTQPSENTMQALFALLGLQPDSLRGQVLCAVLETTEDRLIRLLRLATEGEEGVDFNVPDRVDDETSLVRSAVWTEAERLKDALTEPYKGTDAELLAKPFYVDLSVLLGWGREITLQQIGEMAGEDPSEALHLDRPSKEYREDEQKHNEGFLIRDFTGYSALRPLIEKAVYTLLEQDGCLRSDCPRCGRPYWFVEYRPPKSPGRRPLTWTYCPLCAQEIQREKNAERQRTSRERTKSKKKNVTSNEKPLAGENK